jgi:hypothetical protein
MAETSNLPNELQRTIAWQKELVRRYRAGLPLTVADKKAARQLIKQGA